MQNKEEKRREVLFGSLGPFAKKVCVRGKGFARKSALQPFSSLLRKDNKDIIGRGKNGCMGSLVEQVVPFSLLVAQPTDELAPCRSWSYLLLYPFVKGRERDGVRK